VAEKGISDGPVNPPVPAGWKKRKEGGAGNEGAEVWKKTQKKRRSEAQKGAGRNKRGWEGKTGKELDTYGGAGKKLKGNNLIRT